MQDVRNLQYVMIITFNNYVILVGNRIMRVKHLNI